MKATIETISAKSTAKTVYYQLSLYPFHLVFGPHLASILEPRILCEKYSKLNKRYLIEIVYLLYTI